VEIAGPIRLILYIASDRVDTDFTGKLCDVYPDGRSMLVCDGILRARHRSSMSTEEFLTPGEIYEIEIAVGELAICFAPGHRIRLAVSSSNHDRFDVNPNTGEPFAFEYAEMLVARNTVYQEAAYPSRLVLPVTNATTSAAAASPGHDLRLLEVFPNPANPRVALRFAVDHRQHVAITIHDLQGRRVVGLADRIFAPGEHTLSWNGRDDDGRPAASGVYWIRLGGSTQKASEKLVLLR
jgi:hypothetical protein